MPNGSVAKNESLQALTARVLRERFGHEQLIGRQPEIIARVLGIDQPEGDALCVLPTGSGKSLCYQLPALVLREQARAAGITPGVTLVFSPLIALMADQVEALRRKGIHASYINSTVSKRERELRYAALASGAYELFYATPERMERPGFLQALDAVPGGVRLLAVDECHCITKWGHDLRPAYQRMGEFRSRLGSPRTIALTATATRTVREDVRLVLGADETSMPLFATGIDRPNLSLSIEPAWDDADKIASIVRTARAYPGTGIVYFALIKDLERSVADIRAAMGGDGQTREVVMYHGRLSAREKAAVYKRFIGAVPGDGLLLCATNAFGMGVDKPDIRFVMHAQVPGSVEAYAQEVGRAGRDGKPGACVLLYCEDDLAIQQDFIEWQNPSPDLLVQVASALERRDMTEDFDADELRLEVIGKGHAHGRGGATVEYALIELERLGVIEQASIQVAPEPEGRGRTGGGRGGGGRSTRYVRVRSLDDAEVDPVAIVEKRTRDLTRLLEMVKLTRADDVASGLRAYFEL